MLRNSIINIVLKIGLSIALLYAALASFIVPAKIIGRWPAFISHRIDEGTLSAFTGIVCLALIVWLFFGRKKFLSALVTAIGIGLAGLFNIANVSFLFTLAPLFFIALALSLRYYPRVRIVSETLITPLHEGRLHGEKDTDIEEAKRMTNHVPHSSGPKR